MTHRETGTLTQPAADGTNLPSEYESEDVDTQDHLQSRRDPDGNPEPSAAAPSSCPLKGCIDGLFYGDLCPTCGGRGYLNIPETAA